jgi:hypothetical protein
MKYKHRIRLEFASRDEANKKFDIGLMLLKEQYSSLIINEGEWNISFRDKITAFRILCYLDATIDSTQSLESVQWMFNSAYRCYMMHYYKSYGDMFMVNFEMHDENIALMMKLAMS